MAIKKILVPVDFSSDSLKALAYARDFAGLFGAELSILHVVEPIYYATPADMYVTTPNLTMLLEEQRRVGARQLARLAAELEKKGQSGRTMLKTGAPAQVIIDTARSTRADLIIMATHGRTGLAHMLMGSVAEKVVRGAACPVLTVRRGVGKRRRARKTALRGRKRA
jgi:universal stress protein A